MKGLIKKHSFSDKKCKLGLSAILLLSGSLWSCSEDENIHHSILEKQVVEFKESKEFDIESNQSYQLDFRNLSLGDKIKVNLPTNEEGSRINSVYTFERTEEGMKLIINKSKLHGNSVKIYNAKRELYKEVKENNIQLENYNTKRSNIWPIVVAFIVYNCLEVEVGSNGWRVAFDCN